MNFGYAIFDLDGTIFDSMYYWRTVAVYALEKNGFHVPEDLAERSKHMLVYEAFNLLCTELKTEKKIRYSDISEEYRSKVLRPAYETDIMPKPSAVEFLRMLKDSGVKLCIATATARELFMPAIKRLGMEDLFEFYITTAEVGKSKDHSDIYDIALERLGGTKENTVVFEDQLYCIKTASAAGYRIFAVDDEYSRQDRQTTEKLCERYITDYGMFIKEILNQHNRKGDKNHDNSA